jgi:hypothetical protein
MSRQRKKRHLLSWALPLLIFLIFLAIYVFGVRRDMSDFGVCYQGGERIRQAETLYRISDGHMQYKYSPASAVFFAGFTLLSYEWAKLLWYCLELFFLAISFVVFLKTLPAREKTKTFLGVLSFLILAKFLGREIQLGQVNILIISLLAGALIFLLEGKDLLAGLFWGVSLFFKPYALVFFPYFLLKKRVTIILSGAAILSLGFLLPAFFYGIGGNILVHKEWVETLSVSTPGLIETYDSASLHALLQKFFGGRESFWPEVLIGVALLAIGSVFVWLMRAGQKKSLSRPETLEAAFLIILIPLFSPLGWYYNYLYALLAVMLILDKIDRFPGGLKFAAVVNFIVIGGTLREILGQTLFTFYTGHSLVVLNFLFVLFCLSYLRLKQQA